MSIKVYAGDRCSFLIIDEKLYFAGFGDNKIHNRFIPVNCFNNKKIEKVSVGHLYNFAITTDGELYAAVNEKSSYKFQRIELFKNKKVIDVGSEGCKHSRTFSLTKNKELFVFDNTDKKLVKNEYLSDRKVVQMDIGYNCGLFLTNEKRIYGTGTVFSNMANSKFVEIKKPDNGTVIQVAAGFSRCFILTDKSIYGFGDNSSGELGLGKEKFAEYFEPININNKKIIKISAGFDHSLFLTADGEIYGCGGNEYGQLGLWDTKDRKNGEQIPLPPLHNCKKVIDISAGFYHSLFVTEDNKVFATGANSCGQLGLIYTDNKTWLNHVIPLQPVNYFKIFNNYPFK